MRQSIAGACTGQADVPCCRLVVCDTNLMHPAVVVGILRKLGGGVGAGGSPQRAINPPLFFSTTHLPPSCTKHSEARARSDEPCRGGGPGDEETGK